MKFKNRSEAGRMLARELFRYKGQDIIVLAIPMGGVPVGYEIAIEYNAPLDVVMTKKIGAPFNLELAIGAVTWNGAVMVDHDMVDKWQISRDYISGTAGKLIADMKQTLEDLRTDTGTGINFQKLYDRTVFIVDDGIATGMTMMATVEAIRDQGPKEVVIATPVMPAELVNNISQAATLVCLHAAEDFEAVSQYYEDFESVSKEKVREYLIIANRV